MMTALPRTITPIDGPSVDHRTPSTVTVDVMPDATNSAQVLRYEAETMSPLGARGEECRSRTKAARSVTQLEEDAIALEMCGVGRQDPEGET